MSGAPGEVPLSIALREELGDAIETARTVRGELTVRVRREAVARVCAALRERHGFTRLVDLCGVDFPERNPRFEIVYHLCDPAAGRRVRVKIAAGEETPVPSVTGIWRAADWPEREVWDLFGVRFEGHPDLSRLLLWDDFEGHPLRKDFPVEGTSSLSPSPGEGGGRGRERGPGGEGLSAGEGTGEGAGG